VLALVLVLAACQGGEAAPTTTTAAPGITTAPSTTTSEPVEQTTTTETAVTTASTTPDQQPRTPTLDDGRPATFLGVTTDYEAVEVDTATGEIVRSFGRRATAGDLDSAEFPPNAIDAVWRTTSGSMILVSECCEPAAGRINYLSRTGILSDDHHDPAASGWAVVPSPVSDDVILVGYATAITTPDPTALADQLVFLENDGSGVGAIGWNADATFIHWYDAATGELVTWDPTGAVGDVRRVPITWVDENQVLSGMEARATGELVSFLHTLGVDFFDIVETELVVYRAEDGEAINRLPVEPGSVFGGFDPSGDHFLYTTREGLVVWVSPDGPVSLAEGYLFASW
jgi:hypothetical protein